MSTTECPARRLRIGTLGAILALLGAALLTSSAGATNGQPTQALPFHATILGATTNIVVAENPFVGDTFGGRCSIPSAWVISFAGTGEATHLGSFAWSSSHCTQLGASPPATVTITDGRFVYTTANGDVLRESYGNAEVTLVTPETVCIDTHATFTGGTGRFSGASGSALESTCFPNTGSPVLAELLITSSGTIVYDASNRAG